MTVLATAVLVGFVVVVAALLPVVVFRRCRRVDAVRSQRLREIHEVAITDMEAGRSWEWRFDAYRKGPTFNEMVWKMWRPAAGFYEDSRSGVPDSLS